MSKTSLETFVPLTSFYTVLLNLVCNNYSLQIQAHYHYLVDLINGRCERV